MVGDGAVLDRAHEGFGLPANAHLVFRIPGADPERRSGAPLAFDAVAQIDSQRLALRFDAQLPAGAMRGACGHARFLLFAALTYLISDRWSRGGAEKRETSCSPSPLVVEGGSPEQREGETEGGSRLDPPSVIRRWCDG